MHAGSTTICCFRPSAPLWSPSRPPCSMASYRRATWYSMKILLQGYACGLFFAGLLTALASATRIGADLLEVPTAMFNPAVNRAFAAGDDLVRPGQWRRHLRAHPRRALGGGAQHAFRLSRRQSDLAYGWPELRPVESRLRASHSHSRCVSQHPNRASRSVGLSPGAH